MPYYLGRGVMDILRGLNEFALGLIFVAAIGLCLFPGVLALTLHTAGLVGAGQAVWNSVASSPDVTGR